MNTSNNIPDTLMQWLESRAWSDLSETEKSIAGGYLSAHEYTDLRQLFLSTQDFYKINAHVELPGTIKQNLDKAFKIQHQKGMLIPLWQAAAVLLCILSGFVFYTMHVHGIEKTIVNTIHDTLYVPQYVESKSKNRDTVVVYKYIQSASYNAGKVNTALNVNESKHENYLPTAQNRALSPDEIKNRSGNIKNKSMQEDTLYRKIGYASI